MEAGFEPRTVGFFHVEILLGCREGGNRGGGDAKFLLVDFMCRTKNGKKVFVWNKKAYICSELNRMHK